MIPRAASWRIASAYGVSAVTSGKAGGLAKLATAAWSPFIVMVKGLAQPTNCPSSIQPMKTKPGSELAVSVATLPAG